jgi:hypothetical protein
MTSHSADAAVRWLRWGVAFVWLWTGLAVLHPYYRELGSAYLAPLGLPPTVMYVTCAGEVLLGLRVALGRAATWVTVLQFVMIVGFTGILSLAQPALWIDPLGMLTNNLALVVMIGSAWLLEREGWGGRASWVLRGGMAVFWLIDGVLHSFVIQAPWSDAMLLAVVGWLGRCELAAAVLTLFSGNRHFALVLPLLLFLQTSSLAVIVGAVGERDPLLWFHPFGPLTKNVAVAVATCVVIFWCVALVIRRPRAVR